MRPHATETQELLQSLDKLENIAGILVPPLIFIKSYISLSVHLPFLSNMICPSGSTVPKYMMTFFMSIVVEFGIASSRSTADGLMMVSGQRREMYDLMKITGGTERSSYVLEFIQDWRSSCVSVACASYLQAIYGILRVRKFPGSSGWTWETNLEDSGEMVFGNIDVYSNIEGDSLTDKKKKGTAVLRILKELGSTARMLTQTTVDDEMDWEYSAPVSEKSSPWPRILFNLDTSQLQEKPTFALIWQLLDFYLR